MSFGPRLSNIGTGQKEGNRGPYAKSSNVREQTTSKSFVPKSCNRIVRQLRHCNLVHELNNRQDRRLSVESAHKQPAAERMRHDVWPQPYEPFSIRKDLNAKILGFTRITSMIGLAKLSDLLMAQL